MSITSKDEAMRFLRLHQPMPDTTNYFEGCEQLWLTWCEAVDYFRLNPCLESVPLILHSYGGGDIPDEFYDLGWDNFPIEAILPYFLEAFRDPRDTIRDWAVYLSESLSSNDERLIKAYVDCLDDPYPPVRAAAVMILSYKEGSGEYNSLNDYGYIRDCYLKEKDELVKNNYEDKYHVFEAILDLVPGRTNAHMPVQVKSYTLDEWEKEVEQSEEGRFAKFLADCVMKGYRPSSLEAAREEFKLKDNQSEREQ